MKRRLVSVACAVGCVVACGSSDDAATRGAGDGGDAGAKPVVHHDAAVVDAAGDDLPDVVKTRIDRMKPHAKQVLPHLRLVAVYFGAAGAEGSVSFDGFMSWLVSSDYWKTMQQYGVGPGTFVGSVRLEWHSVFEQGATPSKLIDSDALARTVFALLHPGAVSSADAGGDDGAANDDSGLDASDTDGGSLPVDSSAPPTSLIPEADAYIFFLPNGVNVSFPGPTGGTWQTCVEAGGYHSFDGSEPYAIMPPCSLGRSGLAISHEIAEMATDPNPGLGWFSDADVDNAGGEIGDLCNEPVTVEGWSVTQLWSNADGDCEPRP